MKEQIPAIEALGVRILHADENLVEVSALLKPNRNHLGSAFGGSLNTVLLLPCYVWLFRLMDSQGLPGHVILKQSETKYLLPVEADFRAICKAPSAKELEAFLKTLKRKKQAQIILESNIATDKKPACKFIGQFVAKQKDSVSLS